MRTCVLITTRSMHTLHTVALVHKELDCGGALALLVQRN